MNLERASYTAIAIATEGRDGSVKTTDNVLDLKVSSPGESVNNTNPEQLFAAAWAVSFNNTILQIANTFEVEVKSSTVIEVTFDGQYGLSSKITATIEGVDRTISQKIITSAHNMCPYSKATKGNIKTTIELM